jgi:hypothetical protein
MVGQKDEIIKNDEVINNEQIKQKEPKQDIGKKEYIDQDD